MVTLQEQLKQITEAITAIEIGGQEYQLGSMRLKRADLSLLYKRRKELEGQIQAEQNGNELLSNTFVSVFDRR
ncbi:peptidylprolyl isomerase [Gracilibacillus oryzae]|uniref:Peptidylprolyl isomerase n=1 Tax=Gracilibacillus oryzae TaxID=1672701 RepID=A0A7C8GQY3_9BACI|nr:peptidylprolyl isomerase [Gracilibacillus oryzae]KAB8126916.1 peptidylprolyl isomerase [Gracilibacillus oryzae]